jgi:glycosyltransferase involved in cell wall biosynthesis
MPLADIEPARGFLCVQSVAGAIFIQKDRIKLMPGKNNGPSGLRILVVVPFYRPAYVYGGPVRSVPALCEGLSRLGCAVTVFTTNANGDSELDVDTRTPCVVGGVKVFYHPYEKGPFLFYSPTLKRACVEQIRAFDLVYVVSCWTYPFIPAVRAAAAAGIPYVISPRTAFMRATWAAAFLKKLGYHLLFERSLTNRAAAIHFTSRLEMDQSGWLRLQSKPVIVPNPVDISEFITFTQRGSFRDYHSVAADEKVFLYMGRVEPRKGLDLAIQAFGSIASCCGPTRLVIVGPQADAYLRQLKKVARKVGVAKRVTFVGLLTGVDRLAAFRDADIFILTSLAENFAVAAVEAMASRLPLLVTETVGVAADVAAHEAGMVVVREKQALTEAMERLLKNEKLRIQMGESGKRLAQANYNPDFVAKEWLDRLAHGPAPGI